MYRALRTRGGSQRKPQKPPSGTSQKRPPQKPPRSVQKSRLPCLSKPKRSSFQRRDLARSRHVKGQAAPPCTATDRTSASPSPSRLKAMKARQRQDPKAARRPPRAAQRDAHDAPDPLSRSARHRITWRAVRRDPKVEAQIDAGHAQFSTTERCLHLASARRRGFGEPFPALPEPRSGSAIDQGIDRASLTIRKQKRIGGEDRIRTGV